MTDSEFDALCFYILKEFRKMTPYKTGNMCNNATKLEMVNAKTCKIYVDEAIAPYLPYTYYEWKAPRWNGAKNPNEGWFDRACEKAIKSAASLFKGAKLEKK